MGDNSGIIYDKSIQIKILILFVMSRLHRPIALEDLTELTLCDERISYFDVTECIQKLVKTRHLKLVSEKYAMTAKGLRNSEILAEDLPHSVRVKAEGAVSRIKEALERDSLVKTSRSVCDNGGFKVGLSLSDGMGDILSIELLAANEEQAEKLEKGFRKNAQQSLYRNIVNLISK